LRRWEIERLGDWRLGDGEIGSGDEKIEKIGD